MEIDFNPNIRLESTFYDVPGYRSRLHVLTSPIPPCSRSHALSAASDAFEREQILQAEAYHGRLPVVLVHGMVVASTYMHDLGRQLAPWLRVFIPDLPGFGRSSDALGKHDVVSISQMAQGLHDWMDEAGIRTAHFVSNSLGCQILAEFTRLWPERVGRLVLQGPTMDNSRQPLFKTVRAMVANGSNEPSSMGFIMLRDYQRAGWRRALALFREAGKYRIVDALQTVDKPTLLLSSELDPVAPCRWVAELSDKMPNAVHYVLTKAAHTANYSAAGKMSRIVLRYLLVEDDDGIRRAGREILEQVMEINQTREAAAKQRSRLLWRQLALGSLVALLAGTCKGLFGRWQQFIWALLVIESMEFYRYYTKVRPLLSLDRSSHLDRVYVKLQGIADFDSASCMLRAIGRYLHFRDFPQLGVPTSMAAAMPLVNWLPSSLRQTVYAAVGATEAVRDPSTFDAESVTKQVVAHFPAHRKYPAVAIGSSNGALTHLYAAMGIPWLPQTLLMPVKRPKKASIRHGQVDMTAEMEWGRTAAREMLEKNPEIELYHMADPNQDQLMIHRMAYFRLKLIKLTRAYRSYLLDALEANGTVIIVRSGISWPSTKVADRHYFQSGAVGGATPEEFLQGSPDVARFIESQKSPWSKMAETVLGTERRTDWRAPPPSTGEVIPEAEWGYAAGLTDDIVAFARDHGFQIKYLDFEQPEDASPLVANMYRQWNEQQLRRAGPTDSILVESFVLLEPWLAMRYNLSPYWSVFPVDPSLERLEKYLRRCQEARNAFRDGFLFLFCSGVDSVGLAGVDRWKGVLDGHFASSSSQDEENDNKQVARDKRARLVGTDEKVFPRDFGFPARYQRELARAVGPEAQYVMPPALLFAEFEQYMTRNGAHCRVVYQA